MKGPELKVVICNLVLLDRRRTEDGRRRTEVCRSKHGPPQVLTTEKVPSGQSSSCIHVAREQLPTSMSRSRIPRWPLALQSGYVCPACHAARRLRLLHSTPSNSLPEPVPSTFTDNATPQSLSGGFLSSRHARILSSYNIQQPVPSKKPLVSGASATPEISGSYPSSSTSKRRANKRRKLANSKKSDPAPSASTQQGPNLSSSNGQNSGVPTQPPDSVSSGEGRSDCPDPHQTSNSSLLHSEQEKRVKISEQAAENTSQPRMRQNPSPHEDLVRKHVAASSEELVRKHMVGSHEELVRKVPTPGLVRRVVTSGPVRNLTPTCREEHVDAELQSASEQPVSSPREIVEPVPIDNSIEDLGFERANVEWEALKNGSVTPKTKRKSKRSGMPPAAIAAFYAQDLKPING